MRKSEQVIYITLIDFLLQLLFFGLVLWAISSLGKPGIAEQDIKPFGGAENAAGVLRKVKDLMDEAGARDADDFAAKMKALLARAGGLEQVSDLPGLVKDLMDRAGMDDKQEFFRQAGGLVDAAKAAGGLQNAAASLQALKDLMDRTGMQGRDIVARLEAIERAGGIENAQALAEAGRAIREQTGVDDPGLWPELINKGKAAGKPDAPPHIILSETRGFSFPSGSSRLSPEFRDKLEKDVVDRIQQAIDAYGINLIEVIGHTDGVPVKRGSREIDSALEAMAREPYEEGRTPRAVQGSNTDLGMLRALEVVKFLQHLRGRGRLAGIDPATGFRAYSSGQLTTVDGRLADAASRDDDPARRRIEIRLTRLGERIQGQ